MGTLTTPLITPRGVFLPISKAFLAQTILAEEEVLSRPQADILTEHVLHAGMYARTMTLPPNGVMVGALIKIPTMVIVSGSCYVYTEEGPLHLEGYHVIPASANRKQVFMAQEETSITMFFPTQAETVEQAEQEFTDDYARLVSRTGENKITIGDRI